MYFDGALTKEETARMHWQKQQAQPMKEITKQRIEKMRNLLAKGPMTRRDLADALGMHTDRLEQFLSTASEHMPVWDDEGIVGIL